MRTYDVPTMELDTGWELDESGAAPIVVAGSAILALLAALGGAAAVAEFLCRNNGGVEYYNMTYFPNPQLEVQCNV